MSWTEFEQIHDTNSPMSVALASGKAACWRFTILTRDEKAK